MSKLFEDKVVFVTGGCRGIGKGIVERFVEGGAKVAIVDINEEALQETVEEFKEQGHEVYGKLADVTNADEIKNAMAEIVELHGSLDILVNNAGILRDNLLFKMTDDDWDLVMDVHLKGSFIAAREAQKFMVKNNYGRIINISSTSALGNRGQANYSTAKAGLQGFTKTLAIELGKFGITVNAVAPGLIETEMTKETARRIGVSYDDFIEENKANIPVNRVGSVEDIAQGVAFFAEEKSSFISGQILYVAGGPMD